MHAALSPPDSPLLTPLQFLSPHVLILSTLASRKELRIRCRSAFSSPTSAPGVLFKDPEKREIAPHGKKVAKSLFRACLRSLTCCFAMFRGFGASQLDCDSEKAMVRPLRPSSRLERTLSAPCLCAQVCVSSALQRACPTR